MFNRHKSQKETSSTIGDTLYLYVHSLGWTYEVKSTEKKRAVQLTSSNANGIDEIDAEKRIDIIIKQALKQISNKVLDRVNAIHLMLETPHTAYNDSKLNELTTDTPNAVRRYGRQLLNGEAVTYGSAAFHTKNKDGKQDFSAYAFMNATSLRHYLVHFDKNSPKLVEVVPIVGTLLSANITPNSQGIYSMLYFGAYETLFVLVNVDLGSLYVRTIPIGMLSIIQAIAEQSGTTIQAQLEPLSKRSILKNLQSKQAMEGTVEKVLTDCLQQLCDDIQEARLYFAEHRFCSTATEIQIYGAYHYIKDLPQWLNDTLEVKITPAKINVFDTFINTPQSNKINLLKSSDENLIIIGKDEYNYDNTHHRFIQKNRPQAHQKTRPAAKLFGSSNSSKDKTMDEQLTPEQNRMYFAGFFLIIAMMFYSFFMIHYDKLNRYYISSQHSYNVAIETNSELYNLTQGTQKSQRAKKLAAATKNKILWTDKFLTLGAVIQDALWITDIYLITTKQKIAGASVDRKKLVLEGAALPSDIGHISEIAKYIENLKDSDTFMRDFREVYFNGLSIDDMENDDIVRFTLELWYDRNESIIEENTTKQQVSSTQDLKTIQNERNQRVKELLPKGTQ